jgi:hypothetical protein
MRCTQLVRTAIRIACVAVVALAAGQASAAHQAGLRFTSVDQSGFGPVLTNAYWNANVVIV